MITLRGSLEQGILDARHPVNGKEQHTHLLPGGMVHSGHMGEHGADALDIFWPVRPDYIAYAEKQNALYREVIDPGVKPVKLAEGFVFTEGPTWLKGNLYFSDMHFRADWSADVSKSRTIRMSPDGKWKAIATGMQTNGTIASRRGHLLVCDMFGHRVIEMSRHNGRRLRTVLSKVGGTRIDGPNDIVMDLKGGIYVTDPQFIPDAKKMPGTQVYYRDAKGKSKVVIPAGEYAMPNGVEISPDGKTFYVNNTWLQPGENFVYAYDVQEDGSLTNKRKFAMLNLGPEVLDAEEVKDRFNSQADGMAVDMRRPHLRGHALGRADLRCRRCLRGNHLVPAVSGQPDLRRQEQRRALHGGPILGVVHSDQSEGIPVSGGTELRALTEWRVKSEE